MMPQMAPMSWLLLMILLILSFIIFMTLNYFLMQPSTKTFLNIEPQQKVINWKW